MKTTIALLTLLAFLSSSSGKKITNFSDCVKPSQLSLGKVSSVDVVAHARWMEEEPAGTIKKDHNITVTFKFKTNVGFEDARMIAMGKLGDLDEIYPLTPMFSACNHIETCPVEANKQVVVRRTALPPPTVPRGKLILMYQIRTTTARGETFFLCVAIPLNMIE